MRQMIIVRQGLEAGVDVSRYADPSVPSGEMEQAYRRLKEEQAARPSRARGPRR